MPTENAAPKPSIERAQAIHLRIFKRAPKRLEAALITNMTMILAKKTGQLTKKLMKAQLIGAALLPLLLDWQNEAPLAAARAAEVVPSAMKRRGETPVEMNKTKNSRPKRRTTTDGTCYNCQRGR